MSHFAPIRDEAGAIVGMQPKGRGSQFSATLAETMAAVGASDPAATTPTPGEPPPAPRQRLQAALGVVAIVCALALFVLANRPTVQVVPAPTATPTPTATATPRTIPAYWAPGGPQIPAPIAASMTYRFIGRLGADWAQLQLPGGGQVWARASDLALDAQDRAALAAAPDRATPTMAPSPVIIVQQAPPCYSARQDVYDGRGYQIGQVEGYSCESREAAEAEAARRAQEVKAAQERK